MQTELLKYGQFYHIYNRGIDSCDLFREPDNYEHFLGLYNKYISPVAETYAWTLMPNHFHLLVRVKEKEDIGFIPYKPLSGSVTTERVEGEVPPSAVVNPGGCLEDTRNLTGLNPGDEHLSSKPLSGSKTNERVEVQIAPSVVYNPDGGYGSKKYKPENQFSHLFNSYAQAFNKRFGRTGSLFQHPFKRKLIDNEKYLKHVILYIHNNPVHHGFCDHPVEYPWSSYLTCISIKRTRLKRESVLGWFDGDANFRYLHQEKVEIEKIEKWLGINE